MGSRPTGYPARVRDSATIEVMTCDVASPLDWMRQRAAEIGDAMGR